MALHTIQPDHEFIYVFLLVIFCGFYSCPNALDSTPPSQRLLPFGYPGLGTMAAAFTVAVGGHRMVERDERGCCGEEITYRTSCCNSILICGGDVLELLRLYALVVLGQGNVLGTWSSKSPIALVSPY